MKAVVQRVSFASVKVNNSICGSIDKGILVYIGFDNEDTEDDINWMVNKIPNLRIFPDKMNKLNLSTLDLNYNILIISQFTLLGSCKKGRRPSYNRALNPDDARIFYDIFLAKIKHCGLVVQSGIFQEHMDVTYNNDGPITIIIDSKE